MVHVYKYKKKTLSQKQLETGTDGIIIRWYAICNTMVLEYVPNGTPWRYTCTISSCMAILLIGGLWYYHKLTWQRRRFTKRASAVRCVIIIFHTCDLIMQTLKPAVRSSITLSNLDIWSRLFWFLEHSGRYEGFLQPVSHKTMRQKLTLSMAPT